MMKIPSELIDEVRSEVNILDIVSQKVQLHKSGKNWFGFCPFHPENTPSFSVNEQKQIFNCFSCHRGGNVYKFIMESEGLTFPEAFIRVAELGNVHLDPKYLQTNALDSTQSSENGKLIDLYQKANQLYHHILVNTELGQDALDYLHKREINDDLIEKFQLGYAPETDILKNFVKEKKIDYQLLRKSGLFIEHSTNSDNPIDNLTDRFKGRVMFPIRNENAHPIAFSGRILNQVDVSIPKYLNSPETPIFNKRRVLFNLDKAKVTMRQNKSVILFEGFMDVISAYKAGVTNGVASMGTSLTDEQVRILSHLVSNLSICYDGDDPGQKATKRALEMLMPLEHFDLGVINLPDKLDPDEIIKKYGADKFKEFTIDRRETPINFFMRYYAKGINLENENDQLTYITAILKELATIKDPIERDLYLNRLASRFGIEYQNLESQLQSLITQQQQNRQESEYANFPKDQRSFNDYQKEITNSINLTDSETKYSRIEKAERLLLYRLLHDHSVWVKVHEIENFTFIHENYQTIYVVAEGYFNQYNEFKSAVFLDYVQDEQLQKMITDLEMEEYLGEATNKEIDDCINLIMDEYPIDEKLKIIEQKINKAKRMNDSQQLMSLIMEKTNLLRQKDVMKSTLI